MVETSHIWVTWWKPKVNDLKILVKDEMVNPMNAWSQTGQNDAGFIWHMRLTRSLLAPW